ncbi:4,5-DOPA dioxygenase extradiol [Pontibacter harenae]|uniref:4,5-DOPA-extradiol-dioxygenase n=1 Tax=Pontibacter harenae TaxID=2894083 RepID=UPI001E520869|nr:4,5-DOPA dioxygenase extradiol [Pontibacter harenae]MCC9168712.1 4,5-DOPA dioxygenase extradiol [Pontibacter harenae]
MSALQNLKKYTDRLATQSQKMPAYFIGHGSPMIALEESEITKNLRKIGEQVPTHTAILCISAHWETKGTFITAMDNPRTIHDFYGFPQALFDVQYTASGSVELAEETKKLVQKTELQLDHEWGFDHGAWTVVKHMYPKADIPMVQLSLDYTKPAAWHYELAKELAALRQKGVLIVGSGNIVHNLRMLDWRNPKASQDWAAETNERVKSLILQNDHKPLQNYTSLGRGAALAIPTPEHYLPLLYTLGMKEEQEPVQFINDEVQLGAISMTSVKIG